jgi:hypothetical protein
MEKLRDGWRKLHNKKLHDVYSQPDVIKSRRIRWVENISCMGRKSNNFGWKALKVREHFEDIVIDESII